MTKHHVIDRIARNINRLDDEGLEHVADYIEHLAGDTVYASLPEAEKQSIDEAIASLDRGERVPGDRVLDALRARIAAAHRNA